MNMQKILPMLLLAGYTGTIRTVFSVILYEVKTLSGDVFLKFGQNRIGYNISKVFLIIIIVI